MLFVTLNTVFQGLGRWLGGKRLLCKQEDMDLDPQDTHKKLGASSHIGRLALGSAGEDTDLGKTLSHNYDGEQ